MRIVTLSDLHIGKWGEYGLEMLSKEESMEGDILWLNGDIIEPDKGVDEREVFRRIQKMKERYSHIVWVAGNNCLEMSSLVGNVSEYRDELAKLLGDYDIHLLDNSYLEVSGFALIGSIGWSNGDLWVKSEHNSDYPNDFESCKKAAQEFFRDKYSERCIDAEFDNESFFKDVMRHLMLDVNSAKSRSLPIVLGTHFVTSKDFCLFGETAKYDTLNYYMGFDGTKLYSHSNPVLSIIGHSHRRKIVTVGGTKVHNVSGSKEPLVFDL